MPLQKSSSRCLDERDNRGRMGGLAAFRQLVALGHGLPLSCPSVQLKKAAKEMNERIGSLHFIWRGNRNTQIPTLMRVEGLRLTSSPVENLKLKKYVDNLEVFQTFPTPDIFGRKWILKYFLADVEWWDFFLQRARTEWAQWEGIDTVLILTSTTCSSPLYPPPHSVHSPGR